MQVLVIIAILFSGTALAKGKKFDKVFRLIASSGAANTHVRPSSDHENFMKEQGYDYAGQNSYGPNLDFNTIGFGVAFNGYSFAASHVIELNPEDENEDDAAKGETKGADYSFSWFGDKHGFSVFYQNFEGLHLGGTQTDYNPSYQTGDPLPYYENAMRSTASLTYYNQLYNGGFSLSALTNFDEVIYPGFASSVIWSVGGSQSILDAGGEALLHSSQQAYYPKSGNLESITLQEVNTTLGFGMSQSFYGFYAALYAGLGPSLQSYKLSYLDDTNEDSTNTYASLNGLFAIGYSGKTFFAGMYMHYEATRLQTDELEIDMTRGARLMTAGFRC